MLQNFIIFITSTYLLLSLSIASLGAYLQDNNTQMNDATIFYANDDTPLWMRSGNVYQIKNII